MPGSKPEPEPRNGLGRHLTPEEKFMLAVLAIGETSTWTDTEYYTWIIWGLLNKITFDLDAGWHRSVYQSWQMEETDLINGDLKQIAGDKTFDSPEDMLLYVGELYKSGQISDKKGGDLAKEFDDVLMAIDTIESLWYAYGPGSSYDPTGGGLGHVKPKVNESKFEGVLVTDEKLKDEAFMQGYRNACEMNSAYSAVTPLYQLPDGSYMFAAFNGYP